jgi:hypothetical protein
MHADQLFTCPPSPVPRQPPSIVNRPRSNPIFHSSIPCPEPRRRVPTLPPSFDPRKKENSKNKRGTNPQPPIYVRLCSFTPTYTVPVARTSMFEFTSFRFVPNQLRPHRPLTSILHRASCILYHTSPMRPVSRPPSATVHRQWSIVNWSIVNPPRSISTFQLANVPTLGSLKFLIRSKRCGKLWA